MAAPRTSFEIVIVGGGPAGCAAAISARRQKLHALIVERDALPGQGTCPGWLGPAAIRGCRECGVDALAAGVEFRGLRLRSWDFKRCVEVDDPELIGCVADPSELSRALLEAACSGGAELLRPVTMEEVRLGETCVTLRLSNRRTVEGQVVLIADGVCSPGAEMVHMSAAWQVAGSHACARTVLNTAGSDCGLDLVLGSGRGLKLATIARGRRQTRVMLRSHDDSVPVEEQLEALVAAGQKAGVLPPVDGCSPCRAHCLAGSALEMESHVGKRCLLIGDAGGFVTSFSGEGMYPALRSGWLAAEAVLRSLAAPVLQDELAAFSATWRGDLAEYLQMPNTDLGLLMPMVFDNAQMSRRIARAFLLGQVL